MQVPQHRTSRKYGFNMTPMIDVVFLLIIFFLVSSHLARQESQLELALPTAASGQEDPQLDVPRITINVRDDGSLLLAGRPIQMDQLKDRFSEVRDREGENVEVRIRGSRAAPYARFEPIMLACTQAKIWNVTYAVYREDPR